MTEVSTPEESRETLLQWREGTATSPQDSVLLALGLTAILLSQPTQALGFLSCFFLLGLFYACVLSACIYECLVPAEAIKGHWIARTGVGGGCEPP